MTSTNTVQQGNRPPLQPSYILRGHSTQVHSVQFLRSNSRLLTGDADGWVVLWGTASKRAVAVWRAHSAAILGTHAWGSDKIITHGRDNSLKVWQLRANDESQFSTTLPKDNDAPEDHQLKPWLLHSLVVNTMNFCSVACSPQLRDDDGHWLDGEVSKDYDGHGGMLIAVPGANDKQINVMHLPSEKPICIVPVIPTVDTGMVMALRLLHCPNSTSTATDPGKLRLLVLAGFESGIVIVHELTKLTPEASTYSSSPIYMSHPHKQPILSLAYSHEHNLLYTSGADQYITSHPLPHHPSFPHPPEPKAATSSATLSSTAPNASKSSLSALLSSTMSPSPQPNPTPSLTTPRSPPTFSEGLKSSATGHAGQQSLTLRSDARILATAGWDAKVRIYSAKTLKEVAVLKYHREGCYAVGFAHVYKDEKDAEGANFSKRVMEATGQDDDGDPEGQDTGGDEGEGRVVRKGIGDLGELKGPARDREVKARSTHWVAVGSKDGNVILWEVY